MLFFIQILPLTFLSLSRVSFITYLCFNLHKVVRTVNGPDVCKAERCWDDYQGLVYESLLTSPEKKCSIMQGERRHEADLFSQY